jgi:hypothetical protein
MKMKTVSRISPLLLLLAGACGDPGAVLEVPPIRSMTMFVVLDPDRATQPTLIKPASPDGILRQLGGTVHAGGSPAAALAPTDDPEGNSFHPCAARYGGLTGVSYPRCLDFALRPQFGATYRVTAQADGYPAAWGEATVPGDFRLVSVHAPGGSPGTDGLEVTWTRSAGAYRYVVALRSEGFVKCLHRSRDCAEEYRAGDFMLVTTDTSVSTVVPEEAVARGKGGWVLDVYAMERNVFEYLTTGTGAEPFPVPPVQNVSGGYGSVGAWVRRSHVF